MDISHINHVVYAMIVPTNQPARVLYALLKPSFFGEAHASSKFGLESRPGEIGPGSCLGLPPCHSKSTKQTTLSGSGVRC